MTRLIELIRGFDEGRLVYMTPYTRSITVNDWKDNIPGNAEVRKGWATLDELTELKEAGLVDGSQKLFVVIKGGNKEWKQ